MRRDNPGRKVVFLAAGFETTTAPAAALLAQGAPDEPAVPDVRPAHLAGCRDAARFGPAGLRGADRARARRDGDGPGGVGVHPARPRHADSHRGLRAGVAARGAVFRAATEDRRHAASSTTATRRSCVPAATPSRKRFIDETMDIMDGNWRGIGPIPQSGYVLKDALRARTIRACSCLRTPRWRASARARCRPAATAPRSCSAASIPNECRLYGLACTPRQPVGPCMVSDEGACRIWWANGVRENVWAGRKASGAES